MTPEEREILLRVDARTEYMLEKLECLLNFRDSAVIDITNLKSACDHQKDLPSRVSSLEKWRYVLTGAFSLFVLLVGWGWLTFGHI